MKTSRLESGCCITFLCALIIANHFSFYNSYIPWTWTDFTCIYTCVWNSDLSLNVTKYFHQCFSLIAKNLKFILRVKQKRVCHIILKYGQEFLKNSFLSLVWTFLAMSVEDYQQIISIKCLNSRLSGFKLLEKKMGGRQTKQYAFRLIELKLLNIDVYFHILHYAGCFTI